ncbi:DNA polymerase III subunit chi [Thiohalorhabdus methylotrophus]|uniref:DNA polymerase III subunit chi n=1 Tax=Thiohalorhabdus methylotrophus TaxID=3242694 RepID=A0ABV4TU73_9GAMM
MSPRVDFFRIQGDGETAVLQAACMVAGKAYGSGYRVLLFAASEALLDDLDNRLWTYRAGSFVPHARRERLDAAAPEPVVLSRDCAESGDAEVLVCVSPPPPDCLSGFQRVAEFVPTEQAGRDAARRRYSEYRQAGYELHTHDLRVN